MLLLNQRSFKIKKTLHREPLHFKGKGILKTKKKSKKQLILVNIVNVKSMIC